jgi:hypothetical protein
MPAIPALGMLKQEDLKLKAYLGYTGRSLCRRKEK